MARFSGIGPLDLMGRPNRAAMQAVIGQLLAHLGIRAVDTFRDDEDDLFGVTVLRRVGCGDPEEETYSTRPGLVRDVGEAADWAIVLATISRGVCA